MADAAIGLVLAAGAGTRFGMPKALARTTEGTPWVVRAARTLAEGGCADVVVVLGAMAESAIHLVPRDAGIVIARDWARGQSASLLAGLEACAASDAAALVVTLVDLPDLDVDSVRRVSGGAGPDDLRRATYGGRPGHPVLIGRGHWDALAARLVGDSGAGRYLAARNVTSIDCTSLGGGDDVDRGAA